MRGSRNFCQFYLVLNLFYSLKSGSNSFIAENIYLYFTKGGGATFSRGGGGVQMLISIETHIRMLFQPNALIESSNISYSMQLELYFYYLLFSRGSVRTPYPPLDPHMGNIIITDNIYHSLASNHNCPALICQD